MVRHKAIADLMGLFLDDIDCLLQSKGTKRTAERLGVTITDIEDFIRGSATAAMATRLDLTLSATQELARIRGADGAIGIIVGLIISAG